MYARRESYFTIGTGALWGGIGQELMDAVEGKERAIVPAMGKRNRFSCGGKMRGRWEGKAKGYSVRLLAVKMKRQGVEEEDVDAEEEMLFKEA
jgi:hypothetical protein